MDDWRLINVELDVDVELNASAEFDSAERRVALVEKAADAVENAAAGGWPGGEEGLWWWRERTMTVRVWWRVPWRRGRAGARRGGVDMKVR